jgi:hypothetical protein
MPVDLKNIFRILAWKGTDPCPIFVENANNNNITAAITIKTNAASIYPIQ